ncbi:MAG: hypothetical protein IJZ35_02075 [Clostridia bacterium]|nr:hypothetical protein [Clostridia bacterium]
MKQLFLILLVLSVVIIFSSCSKKSSEVIVSDGKSYNFVSDKNGEIASDSAGNIIVERQDENGNTVTEVLTEKYLIIDNNSLKTPSYDYEIPEDFELKSVGSDPLIENKQGTIQFNIMDKTDSVSDFDEYVSDTYNAAVASGIANSEIEDVLISNIPMKRFGLSMQDDDGAQLESYAYIVKVDNRVLMITVTSKDGGITDVSQADAFVAEIDFNS